MAVCRSSALAGFGESSVHSKFSRFAACSKIFLAFSRALARHRHAVHVAVVAALRAQRQVALENPPSARLSVLERRATAAGGEALSHGLDVQPDLLRRADRHRREARRVLHRHDLAVVRNQTALVHGHEGLARDGRHEVRVLLVGEAEPASRRRRAVDAVPPSVVPPPLVPLRVSLLLALRHRHSDVPTEEAAVRELQRLRRRLGRLEGDVAVAPGTALVVSPQSQVHQRAALAEKTRRSRPRPRGSSGSGRTRSYPRRRAGAPVHRGGGSRALRPRILPPKRRVVKLGSVHARERSLAVAASRRPVRASARRRRRDRQRVRARGRVRGCSASAEGGMVSAGASASAWSHLVFSLLPTAPSPTKRVAWPA